MSQAGDWTPFCVPWSWAHERRLFWRCPHATLMGCVVDGVHDKGPPLGCIVHRDKQLGFRVIPNDMSQARQFIGMHLCDISRSDPANPSSVTFYLTCSPCPCERPQQRQQQQQQPSQWQQQQQPPSQRQLHRSAHRHQRRQQIGPNRRQERNATGAGPSTQGPPEDRLAAGVAGGAQPAPGPGAGQDVMRAGIADDDDSKQDSDSSDSEGGGESGTEDDDGAAAAAEAEARVAGVMAFDRDAYALGSGAAGRSGGSGGNGSNGGGHAVEAAAQQHLERPAEGPARRGPCRCPCHARALTQVLVSQERAEEMEERRAERPYRKQQATGGCGANGAAEAHVVGGGAAAGPRAAGRRLSALPPVPRMSAAPREAGAGASPRCRRLSAAARLPPRGPGARAANGHATATNGQARVAYGQATTANGQATAATDNQATAANGQATAGNGPALAAVKVTAAAGATGAAAATTTEADEAEVAAIAAASAALQGLTVSGGMYAHLGLSECTVAARSAFCSISGRIVSDYLFNLKALKVAVEVDGVLPPGEVPYSQCTLRTYHRGCHRIVPTPPLAVGKLCVGWGWIPGPEVLVMRVVSKFMQSDGTRKRRWGALYEVSKGSGGGGGGVQRKRVAAGAASRRYSVGRNGRVNGLAWHRAVEVEEEEEEDEDEEDGESAEEEEEESDEEAEGEMEEDKETAQGDRESVTASSSQVEDNDESSGSGRSSESWDGSGDGRGEER